MKNPFSVFIKNRFFSVSFLTLSLALSLGHPVFTGSDAFGNTPDPKVGSDAPSPVANSASETGDEWSKIRRLGAGQYGEVYLFRHLESGEEIACKAYKSEPRYRTWAYREYEVLELLNREKCPVPQVMDISENNGQVVILFEALGINLYEYLINNTSEEAKRTSGYKLEGLPLRQVSFIARQVLFTLKVLHEKGYIHTDVKAENILTGIDKTLNDIRLIDFGSTRKSTENTYYAVQTPTYRAPEVIDSQPYTTAIDLWSLGAVLFELATGEVLFDIEFSNEFAEDNARLKRRIEELIGPHSTLLLDRLRSRIVGASRHEQEVFIALLKEMLKLDPDQRITAAKALEHPFIQLFSAEPRNAQAANAAAQ